MSICIPPRKAKVKPTLITLRNQGWDQFLAWQCTWWCLPQVVCVCICVSITTTLFGLLVQCRARRRTDDTPVPLRRLPTDLGFQPCLSICCLSPGEKSILMPDLMSFFSWMVLNGFHFLAWGQVCQRNLLLLKKLYEHQDVEAVNVHAGGTRRRPQILKLHMCRGGLFWFLEVPCLFLLMSFFLNRFTVKSMWNLSASTVWEW